MQDLTFDGNRYDEYDQGLGLNCLATNYYVDLYLGNLGTTGQSRRHTRRFCELSRSRS